MILLQCHLLLLVLLVWDGHFHDMFLLFPNPPDSLHVSGYYDRLKVQCWRTWGSWLPWQPCHDITKLQGWPRARDTVKGHADAHHRLCYNYCHYNHSTFLRSQRQVCQYQFTTPSGGHTHTCMHTHTHETTVIWDQPPMKDHYCSNMALHFYTFVLLKKDHMSYKTTFCSDGAVFHCRCYCIYTVPMVTI